MVEYIVMNNFVFFAILSYAIGIGGCIFLYQRLKGIVAIKDNFDRNKEFWSSQKDFEE